MSTVKVQGASWDLMPCRALSSPAGCSVCFKPAGNVWCCLHSENTWARNQRQKLEVALLLQLVLHVIGLLFLPLWLWAWQFWVLIPKRNVPTKEHSHASDELEAELVPGHSGIPYTVESTGREGHHWTDYQRETGLLLCTRAEKTMF